MGQVSEAAEALERLNSSVPAIPHAASRSQGSWPAVRARQRCESSATVRGPGNGRSRQAGRSASGISLRYEPTPRSTLSVRVQTLPTSSPIRPSPLTHSHGKDCGRVRRPRGRCSNRENQRSTTIEKAKIRSMGLCWADQIRHFGGRRAVVAFEVRSHRAAGTAFRLKILAMVTGEQFDSQNGHRKCISACCS